MIFTETKLNGVYIIEPEKLEDDRGFFARSFDSEIFKERGLNPNVRQCNMSYNKKMGTLRGMHFQLPPFQEVKYLRCIRGKIFDAVVDLRKKSKTYKQWISVEMSAENYKMIFVPEGCVNGFQTLTDEVELFYQASQAYAPEYERGLRWNDPAFNIDWPLEPTEMSEKDRSWPLFKEGLYQM